MQANENGEQWPSPASPGRPCVSENLFGPDSKLLPRPRSPLGQWALA